MFKDVLNHMPDSTVYAQAGLVIFAVVFVGVCLRVVFTPKRVMRNYAEIPLEKYR